jgi:hypothetical protein
MVMLSNFDRFVQSSADIGYSGQLVWNDALRASLVAHGLVGPDRSVTDLSELDGYPGNSFISGSGYLLSADDAKSLVERRDRLRYDLPDDVAVGLMFEQHRQLTGFSEVIEPDCSISQMLDRVESTPAAHLRLQHFPVHRAKALWRHVHDRRLWL